ncbi:MAG: SpoIIE family protein phosphatase [Eubacterium sp.]|nr:SpoIIE family protein phosphatase [Eubacterium sp.]
MKHSRQRWATIGLIVITVFAAIQYVFLKNVPESVSPFAFVLITNGIGIVIFGAFGFKTILKTKKRTILKGILFAAELIGFSVFSLLGSRGMDAVVVSSVVSLYFVFITPLLLVFRKKVNFLSTVATIIAVIALLLMFDADFSLLFSSRQILYLILADLCFAGYVVSVSIFGSNENSLQLTFSQLFFSAVFALIGWVIQVMLGKATFSIPMDFKFWICALFIGIFIRALYGLIQIICQKYVSALKTSLIFSTEIVITLFANPIMCALFGTEATPISVFQIIGAILLIIATVMADDAVTVKLGYGDLQEIEMEQADGSKVRRSSVAKKMIYNTLTFAMITLILTSVICLGAIQYIKGSAVENSKELGESASTTSTMAMIDQLEDSITTQAQDKALMAEHKLEVYANVVQEMADYLHTLYVRSDVIPKTEIPETDAKNDGKWAMQRTLADDKVDYESLLPDSCILGNIEDLFTPVIDHTENIATVYLGTEEGLMASYDPKSQAAIDMGYYEFRDSSWYKAGKKNGKVGFTDTYQDGYGRGLTITCYAPFLDKEGKFKGCVAMDILMKELNESMVNDGILAPSQGYLIDKEGKFIAGVGVDPNAEDPGTIFDEDKPTALASAGKDILKRKDGITSNGAGDGAVYIAYALVDTTDWILCITSPVTLVQKPAEKIYEKIEGNTELVVSSVNRGVQTVVQGCLTLIAFVLLLVTLLTGRSSKKISDPLKKLEEDVRDISEGDFSLRTEVSTNDEIGSLAGSFNYMAASLEQYIVDLKDATAKEQRIASELSLATNIQASMVPTNFDDYKNIKEFDLYATMTPAKEVGGDFYDFFMTDDNHLVLVMADVSGKGVPAALFMAKAKTSIKTRAMMGGSPADILSDVNDQMCEGNEAELFVTVWLAIIDLATGEGMAANAGHEHPALCHENGLYEMVKYRHSPAVATMEGMPFKEHEFKLEPGDSVVVYTDGVTEATDANNELFGEDRLVESLNRDAAASPKKILKNIKEDIDEFVGEAPQFDDLTMLAVKYYGPNY